MKEEAAANAETDKKAKEEIDLLNAADGLIFQSEKQLKDYGDKISKDKKEPILKTLSDLKDAHKEKDLEKIKTATEALNTVWQAASEEMYKAAQDANTGSAPNGATAEGAPGAGDKKDEVKDVDFEEVKDDKK